MRVCWLFSTLFPPNNLVLTKLWGKLLLFSLKITPEKRRNVEKQKKRFEPFYQNRTHFVLTLFFYSVEDIIEFHYWFYHWSFCTLWVTLRPRPQLATTKRHAMNRFRRRNRKFLIEKQEERKFKFSTIFKILVWTHRAEDTNSERPKQLLNILRAFCRVLSFFPFSDSVCLLLLVREREEISLVTNGIHSKSCSFVYIYLLYTVNNVGT
jgi:hypothetical protein